MKSVLISCIPKLNESQLIGLENLVEHLRALGLSPYIWTDFDYENFTAIKVKNKPVKLKLWERIKKISYEMLANAFLDRKKWVLRINEWLDIRNEEAAKEHLTRYIKEAAQVFTLTKPDYFLCWNPYCCRFGIANEMGKILGLEIRGIEWGYLPNTFLLDRKGTLATSELYQENPLETLDHQKLLNYSQTGSFIIDKLKAQSLSLYRQDNVDIPKAFLEHKKDRVRILVLAIDEIDAGGIPSYHSDRLGLLPFHDSSFHQAKAISESDELYDVIFKPHPSHNKYASNTLISKNLAVVNGNPDELIDWADVVFCSGSKMEFSVILKDKPLLTFGAGLLYGKNCSYEVSTPRDLKAKIQEALTKTNYENQKIKFEQFLGYLENEYLYNYLDRSEKALVKIL